VPDDTVTLIIETPTGAYVRTVPAASPLRDDLDHGAGAEEATQDAAAVWGLPDFVYRGGIVRAGPGSREIGDRLLIVGNLGVVIQVKSRGAVTSDAAREQRWLTKHIATGLRQAHGTIRRLRLEPRPLTNGRGRTVLVDAAQIKWVAVVVVNHPEVPENVFCEVSGEPNPSVVLVRRDWEFLFAQLKSSHAVAQYLARVAGDSSELGTEPVRYYELAQADEQAEPGFIDPRFLARGERRFSTPLLPMAPADFDERPQLLVRLIFEDIATAVDQSTAEEDRVRFLAELDRLPVSARSEVGGFLLEAMQALEGVQPGETTWRVRKVTVPFGGERTVQLGFGLCSSEYSEMYRRMFASWVELRHHEAQEAMDEPALLTTIGVVLTPPTSARTAVAL